MSCLLPFWVLICAFLAPGLFGASPEVLWRVLEKYSPGLTPLAWLWAFLLFELTTAASWCPEAHINSKPLLPYVHRSWEQGRDGFLAAAPYCGEQHSQHPLPILH